MDPITYFMWIALIVVAFLIVISATDELFLDIAFIFYRISRAWKKKKYKYPPLTYEQLSSLPEKKIAVMVPCWAEHAVIGHMLRHNIPAIDYKECDFFVGAYPNDKPTIEVVESVNKQFKNVHCVINSNDGPTSKADNLNEIYQYIQIYEAENHVHYDIIVFHDSEDIIHPISFKLYNYLIPRKDMVQIPIFPLEVPLDYMTHWTYADEFAENHTKIMIVREFIHGLVPCAGVGVGFSRSAIDLIAKKHEGTPFNLFSLTEDYDVALQIHNLHLKSIFLTQTIEQVQTKKRWMWFGKVVPQKIKLLVATKALFPKEYKKAVRQRARWITGIALQEWVSTGWMGNFATRYTLFHDRKALFSHFLNCAGYIVFIYWLIYIFFNRSPSLSILLDENPMVWYLILGCTVLMLIRLLQRVLSTYKIYGLFPALLSVPRTVYSNFLNFHATLRAYSVFFGKAKLKMDWDKTENRFPTLQELRVYKRKLGELLIENNFISTGQLNLALKRQQKTKEKLGDILVKEASVSPQKVLSALGKQYDLEVVDIKLFKILAKRELPFLSDDTYDWLLKNSNLPISFFNGVVTLAITNPGDQIMMAEIRKRLFSVEVKFVLSSDAVKF